ncbi:MAG: sensor histidine kinase [Acidimicrobiales bacterium]
MGLAERLVALIRPMGGTSLKRPRVQDWVGGAALAAAVLAEAVLGPLPGPVASAVVGMIGAATFVVRRVWPLHAIVVFGLSSAATDVLAGATDMAIELTFAAAIAGFALLYNAGRWARPKTVAITAVVAFVIVPVATNANPLNRSSVALTIVDALVQVQLVAIGLLVRSVAHSREQRELAAELQERNLLANDIHDSFAHHMSAIAIRAEAARQLDNPAELDDALRAIKQSASTGLADLRHFVVGLRAPNEPPRPLPGFGDLEHLAAELSTDALRIDVEIDAPPESIPVSVSAAAFWITREALTNVIRHATSATEAHVRTRSSNQHLDLTVIDDGATPTTHKTTDGHGLSSMAARAHALGGDLSAGPNPNGGWLVAARLPVDLEDR